jgi:hypothetical protein
MFDKDREKYPIGSINSLIMVVHPLPKEPVNPRTIIKNATFELKGYLRKFRISKIKK